MKKLTLLGQRFGRWLVVAEAPRRKGLTYWTCICDCGKQKDIRGGALIDGSSQSCGCYAADRARESHTTHGQAGTRDTSEYQIWAGAKGRATNPNDKYWLRYGGRGIGMCERWANGFEAFYTDMGPRPTPKHTLERVDNEKGYGPDNCVWATRAEQNRNQRRTVRIQHEGREMCMADFARHLGIDRKRFRYYYVGRNLPLEVAVERCRQTGDNVACAALPRAR